MISNKGTVPINLTYELGLLEGEMFYSREREIKALESLYGSERFEFAVMYGRRRVGKTSILTEFIKEKPDAIYYVAQEYDKQASLDNFSQAVYKHLYASSNEHIKNAYAVRRMIERGILSGYDDGAYTPENLVTYDEFAALIEKVLYSGNDGYELRETPVGWNVPEQSVWASAALKYCYQNHFFTANEVKHADKAPSKRRAFEICGLVKDKLPNRMQKAKDNYSLFGKYQSESAVYITKYNRP